MTATPSAISALRRGIDRWRPAVLSAFAVALALCCAQPAAASPIEIHAHRGGPYVEGEPRYPEASLPAFRNAAANGYVLELDAKLTKDRVPVVMHDATLDRTTNCSGRVDSLTSRELRKRCRIDVLGVPGNSGGLPVEEAGNSAARVPTLAEVLALGRERGARLNLEIKNVPTDPDFDSGPGFADAVLDVVAASGFPPSRLIVQSFWPPNLDRARERLPGIETSLLTLRELNEGGPAFADARGYDWVSPGWPVTPAYVSEAHALGLRVAPYTLDRPQEVRDAAEAAVDALISDDPAMARRVLAELEPGASAAPAPPSAEQCAELRATRHLAAIEAYDPAPDAPRVFAMQFKQDVRHVVTYESFRAKIECMVREHVLPRLAADRPNVVAFNEDVGLATIATGTRGRAARDIFAGRESPSCGELEQPCGAFGALGTIAAAYGPQLAAYRTRFPDMPALSAPFVAATDTFGRGWMQVFSDLAKRYGVYILGSNNQPQFRESTDPTEIELFADPDLPERPGSVFVATSPEVYNEVFMWGPRDLRSEGPRPMRNVVARNKKVPLTPIEEQLQMTPGPSTGPDAIENVAPYRLPGTDARISFATSLPAFVYGELPAGTDPCSDTSRWYMRCLDRLGANVVMQDEANPGKWARYTSPDSPDNGAWQPLSWMTSTWRAAADPSVDFTYNVTPHMVGNLADLAFDGQTAITQRGLATGPPCHYVGNSSFVEGRDPEQFFIGGETLEVRPFAGAKAEFVALAPWVRPDGSRDELEATADELGPDGNGPLENDYLETAIVADLPFPPDAERPSCTTAPAP